MIELSLRTLAVPLAALLVLTGACASGGAGSGTGNRACALRQTDSAFARSGPVYRACAVDRAANLRTRNVKLDYKPIAGSGCYAAELEFVVDTAGLVEMSTVRIVSSNEPTLARALTAALARFKYTPAELNGVPVRQITTEGRKFFSDLVTAPVGVIPPSPSGQPAC